MIISSPLYLLPFHKLDSTIWHYNLKVLMQTMFRGFCPDLRPFYSSSQQHFHLCFSTNGKLRQPECRRNAASDWPGEQMARTLRSRWSLDERRHYSFPMRFNGKQQQQSFPQDMPAQDSPIAEEFEIFSCVKNPIILQEVSEISISWLNSPGDAIEQDLWTIISVNEGMSSCQHLIENLG